MAIGLDLDPSSASTAPSSSMPSSWAAVPARTRLAAQPGVEEGALGLSLTGIAAGTLISLSFASTVIERVGYRRSLLMLLPLVASFLALASFATAPLWLFVLLLPVGIFIGAIELIINLDADRTEHLVGRRIMSRSHAFWSGGFFCAGLLGAGIAQLGVPIQIHLLAMIPVIVVATLVLLGRYQPSPPRAGTSVEKPPRFARPTLPILVLVAATLSAMILEGAGADWSAIYMRDTFTVSPFLAGLAVALGALTQAIARFFADSFVERYSPTIVARVLLTILLVGTLLVFFADSPWTALAGFGIMGIGTSALFPLSISAAAQLLTDRR